MRVIFQNCKHPYASHAFMTLMGFSFLLLTAWLLAQPAHAFVDHIDLCKSDETPVTCIADGDTIWFKGEELTLSTYDAPEIDPALACGGEAEIALGHEAAQRLKDILNHDFWSIQRLGKDESGDRTLAIIQVVRDDAALHMIEDGFARPLPDGKKFWCQNDGTAGTEKKH